MSAVLLTGTGKRYDIVASFAQHARVVACDPNPISPAQYAAILRKGIAAIRSESPDVTRRSACTARVASARGERAERSGQVAARRAPQ